MPLGKAFDKAASEGKNVDLEYDEYRQGEHQLIISIDNAFRDFEEANTPPQPIHTSKQNLVCFMVDNSDMHLASNERETVRLQGARLGEAHPIFAARAVEPGFENFRTSLGPDLLQALTILKKRAWLNDDTITAVMTLICSSTDKRILATPAEFAYAIRDRTFNLSSEFLTRISSCRPKLLLIPHNVNNSHWHLIIIDTEDGIFYLLDTLPGTINMPWTTKETPEHMNNKPPLAHFYRSAKEFLAHHEICDLKSAFAIDVGTQSDSYSCGWFVARLTLAIIQYKHRLYEKWLQKCTNQRHHGLQNKVFGSIASIIQKFLGMKCVFPEEEQPANATIYSIKDQARPQAEKSITEDNMSDGSIEEITVESFLQTPANGRAIHRSEDPSDDCEMPEPACQEEGENSSEKQRTTGPGATREFNKQEIRRELGLSSSSSSSGHMETIMWRPGVGGKRELV